MLSARRAPTGLFSKMYYALTDHFEVDADEDATWTFFSDTKNLPRITPDWLHFTVTTPGEITLGKDSVIDYTIRWMGIPLKWRTLLIDWQPPHRFIDLQIRGPYALWHHEHTFTPLPDGGTRCFDRVIYKVPFGPVGRLAHPLTVRRNLIEIFRYRREKIGQSLGWRRALQPDPQIGRAEESAPQMSVGSPAIA